MTSATPKQAVLLYEYIVETLLSDPLGEVTIKSLKVWMIKVLYNRGSFGYGGILQQRWLLSRKETFQFNSV